MKFFAKFLKWGSGSLGVLVIGLIIFVYASGNKTYDAELPDLSATQDSAMIARGKYLAFGPAHCVSCHTPMDKSTEIDNGLEMPLVGGWELTIPPGTFRAPNLTPDIETGIGGIGDGHLARGLRYSVRHNGKAMFPFMPFQNISDDDLVAILSFLRSQPAVSNKIKNTEYSFLGKAIMAFGLVPPEGPSGTPPKIVDIDSTIAYGKYLSNSVANCRGCHSMRDLKTGAFIGVDFAGGMPMESDPSIPGVSFISPNLTPHPDDGIMAKWSESTFIARFKAGRIHDGSPMPWGAFSRMNDLELKAVYRYLQSLDPTSGSVEKTFFGPGDQLPS